MLEAVCCVESETDGRGTPTVTDDCALASPFQGNMDGSRASLWLLLLLTQLLLRPTDQDPPEAPHPNQTEASSSHSASEPNITEAGANETEAGADGPFCDCLVDTELGLIAIGSAGGLIVCLLLSTAVLACQVYHIQRRLYVPRTSRSNADLVSGRCYWEADQPEAQGLVGPCDASVMLEEVREEQEEEPREENREEREEAGAAREEQAATTNVNCGEKTGWTASPGTRDSCLELLKDLEDMPLVV